MSNKFERRDTDDRRQEEFGPPQGWRDRRRQTERRMPEIDEFEVSELEWEVYFGSLRQAPVATEAAASSELPDDAWARGGH
jgi:hypothetical protein